MKKLIMLLIGLLVSFSLLLLMGYRYSQKPFYRFGYIRTPVDGHEWKEYEQLFDGTYTHILLAFLEPERNGSLVKTEALFSFSPDLVHLAKKKHISVLLSIGGAKVPFDHYTNIAQNEKLKTRFLEEILHAVQEMDADGIDLNFEGWNSNMTFNDAKRIDELAVFIAEGVKKRDSDALVTITLPALYYLPVGFSCETVNHSAIDFAHHMSYDYAEKGTESPNAPMRNPKNTVILFRENTEIEQSIFGSLEYLEKNGCFMKKIIAGIPFYSSDGDRWNEVSRIRNWKTAPIDPFFLEKALRKDGEKRWVDDPESVSMKSRLYKQMGLSGVAVWEVGYEGPVADLSFAIEY